MRIRTYMAGFPASILAVSIVVATGVKGITTASVQSIVDDVLRQYGTGTMSWVIAHAKLNDLPADEVISAVVVGLNRDPGLSEGAFSFAYSVLRAKHAARTEAGFQQLLIGLWNPEVAVLCAEGLLDAPQNKEPEAAANIKRYLRETKEPANCNSNEGLRSLPSKTDLNVRRILKAIARERADGFVYVDVLDEILRDGDRSVAVRKWAACAIAQVKPFDEAMKGFQNLDDIGIEAALTAVNARMAQLLNKASEERRPVPVVYEESQEDVRVARAFVLKAFRSTRVETRRAAFEPMGVAYARDIVVVRSPGDYELNSELRPILDDIAAHDPDPALREQAARLLDPVTIARMATAILRERDRPAKREDE